MKILIVEDAHIMARVVQRYLQRMGHTDVHMVESAEDAQAYLKKQSIGLIFVDWSLPGMSGLQLVKDLRAQQAYRYLPIIMVTGHSESEEVVQALKAGVNEYLVKPVQYETLEDKLNQLLAIRIREATPDDAEAITKLILELADYEKLRNEANPDPAALRNHLAPGASPRCEAFIAEHPGTNQVIGFALFFSNYSTFLTRWGIYLEDIYVKPAFRGRGAGKALFKRVVQEAVTRDCQRLDFSVLDWNEPAIDFYKSLGARPMTDWQVMRLSSDALHKLAEGGS